MNKSVRDLIKEIPESHPMNEIGVFNNATLSKGNDNLVTINILCVVDADKEENIMVRAVEEHRMYNDLIGKKIIEIESKTPGAGNNLWYISETFLLEPWTRIVEVKVTTGRTGKRGGRTMIKMSTSGDHY